jgi:hypothetical protein
LSFAAKEEEIVVTARSDRAVAEKDNAGLDDRYREEEIVNIIRDAIAGRHRHDLDRHCVHRRRRKGVVLPSARQGGGERRRRRSDSGRGRVGTDFWSRLR